MRSSVVIPAYNEQEQIAQVIETAQYANPMLINTEHIIVVDNNSTDATAEIAKVMGAKVLSCNEQGKGWAMLEGANYALSMGLQH